MSARRTLTKSSTSMATIKTELKDQLLKWICEIHATNGPLDRKILRDKAMELANSLGVVGFKCSEGWLTLFLKKNGFSPSLTSCDGPIFTDYKIWIDNLRSLITQYRHKDLFNVDELVMYSHFLPYKKGPQKPSTHRQKGEENGKSTWQNDESLGISERNMRRIGILLCCNSSGTEKLEPLITNPHIEEKMPKDSSGKHPQELSCRASDEAFGVWLGRLDDKMKNAHRNILLLLNRERIRSLNVPDGLSNVKLVFLPKDFPSQLRPLRGDIFHSVKMTYRRRYVEYARRKSSEEWPAKEIVEGIFEAWKDVSQELIVSSFQRTKFREDDSFLRIQCPDWDSSEAGMSFHKFVTFDDELSEISDDVDIREDPSYLSMSGRERRYNLRKNRQSTIELDEDNSVTEKLSEKRNIFEPSLDTRKLQTLDKSEQTHEALTTRPPEELLVKSDIDVCPTFTERPAYKLGDPVKRVYENPVKRRKRLESSLQGPKFLVGDFCTSDAPWKSRDSEKIEDLKEVSRSSLLNGPPDSSCGGDWDEEKKNTSKNVGTNVAESLEARQSEESSSGNFGENGNQGPETQQIQSPMDVCDRAASSNDIGSLRETPEPGNSKRLHSDSGDYINNEIGTKRLKLDNNHWSKRFESNFVFGPINNRLEKITENPTTDEEIGQESSITDNTKLNATGSATAPEKRSIFTLEGKLQHTETQRDTKD